MKYYIKKYQTPAGPIENTYWSDVKIEGLTPLKIEKIDTGQTKKVKVGRKQQYLQKDGTWTDKVDKNTLNGQSIFNYGKGVTFRWVDIYEDQPIYKGRYLYKKDPTAPKSTTISKSTTKSTSSNVNNRVTIPEQYKEGLAEIKDGLTFYTFPKYTNKQVTQTIQELFGNNVPTQKQLYKDYKPEYKPEYKENSIQQSATSNQQNSKSPNQKVQQKETSVKNNNESLIDKITNIFSFSKPENKTQTKKIITGSEAKEYYAYPYEVDQFYNISPEVYSQVSSYLKSKYGKSGNKLKEYIFTEKPLTYYKPGETFRDTVYTFVNSGGVESYPLIRSTLDYKKDRVSDPVKFNKLYLNDNKIKRSSDFSDSLRPECENIDLRSSVYKEVDVENMNQAEKEKFKQFLKNIYQVEFSDEDLKHLSKDYYDFKLTDFQKQKIEQIDYKNIQRYEKYKESFR